MIGEVSLYYIGGVYQGGFVGLEQIGHDGFVVLDVLAQRDGNLLTFAVSSNMALFGILAQHKI